MTRDEMRERWRLASVAAIDAEDKAARAKEGRAVFLDALIETLLEQNEGLSQSRAERMARTSEQYKSYLRKMHDLRKAAELLRLDAQDKDRRYWETVSSEATYRAEMRMTQS
jgi:hypothetical protein